MECLPQIHVAAIHAEAGYRSFTPGLGLLCRSKYLFGVGVYSNSKGRRQSEYLAAGWQPIVVGHWKLGAITGLVTGYRDNAVPMAAGFISYKDINVTVIPPMKDKTPLTVGFSWSWR